MKPTAKILNLLAIAVLLAAAVFLVGQQFKKNKQ